MIKVRTVGFLSKVFTDDKRLPREMKSVSSAEGDKLFFEAVVTSDKRDVLSVFVSDKRVTVYDIESVPATYPAAVKNDGYYLRTAPGLFPDRLVLHKERTVVIATRNRSFFFEADSEKLGVGNHRIKITVKAESGDTAECFFTLRVVPKVKCDAKELIVTNWFHTDCIASVYGVKTFSEKHWRLIESFIKTAAEYGQNMLFVPAAPTVLDTDAGYKRPPCQLVGVRKTADGFEFDYSLFDRYCDIAFSYGIKYLEISHLFTQWGAESSPNITVTADGKSKQYFGSFTPSLSKEYLSFLDAFLGSFTNHLKEKGIFERCFFHVSDEPEPQHLATYTAASAAVKKYIPESRIIDALSSSEFYTSGALKKPVISMPRWKNFENTDVKDQWYYVCVIDGDCVPNRFIAQPSERHFAMAPLLYRHKAEGFLQWGFNFYYSAGSRYTVDPDTDTCCDNTYPAGDAFLVYPAKDGPEKSLRLAVMSAMIAEHRMLRTIEYYKGEEFVTALLDKYGFRSFSDYPHDAASAYALRNEIIEIISSL